ncbi:hypothetical protein ACHAXN_003787 [Cyclotella atomus]
MAGCDYNCKFRWADVKHPGSTSDYTAWITSKLDYAIVGDGAFVESDTMAVPIPGKTLPQYQDAYNFYLSQVRITIERAFSIVVHRIGILRSPMSISMKKVPAIVMCLMRLHNYYIDHCGRKCRTPVLGG